MTSAPSAENAPASGRTGQGRREDADVLDHITALAAGLLDGDELAAVTIGLVYGPDGGPAIAVRGPEDLVSRIERAVYGDAAPEAIGTVSASTAGGTPSSARVGTGS